MILSLYQIYGAKAFNVGMQCKNTKVLQTLFAYQDRKKNEKYMKQTFLFPSRRSEYEQHAETPNAS